jgi:zinc protease
VKASASRRLAVTFAVLVALAAPAAAQSRAELARVIRQKVLANGLEVIVVENRGVPLATIEIDVKNGSFTQTPDYTGLPHLYEHMFFKASRQYADPGAFSGRAGELGAEYNGTTSEERVNYYLTTLADSLEGGIRLMAAQLREPLFREDELGREREIVIGEYDRQESNPFFQLTQRSGRVIWGAEWARKNTIGERSVIRGTTPQKMREIQYRYYVPNNTALIVSGDVDAERVFRLAEEILGDWKRGDDPFTRWPIPPMPVITKDTAVVIEQPVSAITVLIQWHGPSVQQDPTSTYAADVFSDALNQPGSILQKKLVDSGLWDGIGVNYYTLNHVGPISISGQTSKERLKAALRALKGELTHIAEPTYIPRETLEEVKAERSVSSAFGLERASELTHTIGFWWAVASLDYFMGYVDNMARQSLGDLKRYADTYITGKPRVISILISPEDRKALGLTEAELVQLVGR